MIEGDTKRYKQYRNCLTKLIRISKRKYLQSYFEQNLTSMKKTCMGWHKLTYQYRQ